MGIDSRGTSQDIPSPRRLGMIPDTGRDSAMKSVIVAAVAFWIVSSANASTVTPMPRGFCIETASLRAIVADGAIVGLTNLRTGEVHAEGESVPPVIPAGIGVIGGHVGEMSQLHIPLAKLRPAPRSFANSVLACYRLPSPTSKVEFQSTADGGSATWKGLTDGVRFYPEDTITVSARIDSEDGGVSFRAEGRSADGGVFGMQVPVLNLHGAHRLVLPSFGGCCYESRSLDGLLSLGGGAPWLEAPIVAAEGKGGSLGIWWEDSSFPPCFCFIGKSDGKISVGLERLNLMPFESHNTAAIPALRLTVTPGGWADAMRPYRDWYTRSFAAELRQRDDVAWASRIRVVADDFDSSERYLRELASVIDPSTVLLHDWQPRAAAFDTALPDWTPRNGYLEQVLRCKSIGFRTMGYVNTYCVNSGANLVERDRIASFALPRRISGYEKYGDRRTDWPDFRAGDLIYLDSLPEGWRSYHSDSMVEWHRQTRTDANYEDVGSTAGDHGNGIVEGISGSQGGTEMFRQLLQKNPDVPMASEHCSDHMAFACRWPMRYPQRWGDETTRRRWMSDLRPVSAFIHGDGSRGWVPTRNAGTEELQVTVAACADALGGLAQIVAQPGTLRARAGIASHLMERAVLFSRLQLQPDFTKSVPYDPVACRYRDMQGNIYEYRTSAGSQQLIGPDGTAIYQRVTGRTVIDTTSQISGWPAHSGTRSIGLNPDAWYCLSSTPPLKTALSITELSEGVAVTRYSESQSAVTLVLDGLGTVKQGRALIRSERPIAAATLNDASVDPPTATSRAYEMSLPARFVFALAEPTSPQRLAPIDGDPNGRYVAVSSGVDRGTPFEVNRRRMITVPGITEPQLALMCEGGGESEITFDFLLRVPDATSAALLAIQSPSLRAGNGLRACIRLNGLEVHGTEIVPNSGERNETWRIPLGSFAGRPLLITLVTDGKADDNCDEVWWSRPILVNDRSQSMETLPVKSYP